MYLFFDTETTGLPRSWKAPVTDTRNWPRLVELAWLLGDDAGNTVMEMRRIIRPEGFTIPPQSTKVHGISQQQAEREGIPLEQVMSEFAEAVKRSEYVIGHNVEFDEKIVGAEYIRLDMSHQLWHRERICTKMESTSFCRLPGKHGYKWPTLQELHQKLFSEPFSGAHSALVDTRATARCFYELKRLDVI